MSERRVNFLGFRKAKENPYPMVAEPNFPERFLHRAAAAMKRKEIEGAADSRPRHISEAFPRQHPANPTSTIACDMRPW
jgi:hypothetical protein